jgi:hypothetical protein
VTFLFGFCLGVSTVLALLEWTDAVARRKEREREDAAGRLRTAQVWRGALERVTKSHQPPPGRAPVMLDLPLQDGLRRNAVESVLFTFGLHAGPQ